eukprot:CAMPEP_0175117238 /NCGR_PEP_ID=MMETSP0086_2-20121207/18747_1 /TAXON_ID=136419 /ORGANISM="Unknown Unknown, Strain D1" /LENGTH=37 /DNA_ID= /DNA_START= /DNA_END= /DNA_ORIENTATION=
MGLSLNLRPLSLFLAAAAKSGEEKTTNMVPQFGWPDL